MRSEQQYSSLVYDYFYLRFQTRCYQYGDCLPTMEALCREFGVSPQTIKTAFRRLREEGYLTTMRGRPAKVAFRQTEQGAKDFVASYYARRWAAFPDLFASGGRIINPLLAEGLRRMDDRELAAAAQLAGSGNYIGFYSFALQKMENPLALNLFGEASLFEGFPFAQAYFQLGNDSGRFIQERLQALTACLKARGWAELDRLLGAFYDSVLEGVTAFLEPQLRPALPEGQLPFVWRIYRERPQRCYSLAEALLHDIYFGAYRGTGLLPSYDTLAETYGASVSALRSAVGLLNKAGAAETINGLGTRAFSLNEPCQPPDFACPAIRRILAFFYQALELIAYSCQAVLRETLQSATEGQKAGLIAWLEEDAPGRGGISLWALLLFIARHSPFMGVREIYGKLYGLLLWGYPLKASLKATPALDLSIGRFTQAILGHLKAGEAAPCAAAMRAFVSQQAPLLEAYLLSQGFTPSELRGSPSIRLLITEGGSAPAAPAE